MLIGFVAATEFWCRAYGGPKLSLLSLFGATAGAAFYSYQAAELTMESKELLWMLWYDIQAVEEFLVSVAFGVAVVGWAKLIGLARKNRK